MSADAIWIGRGRAQLGWVLLIPALLSRGADAQTVELPAQDHMLSATVTELATLGTLDGGDWQAFGRVRSVAFGPDGDLFILDQQAVQVHRVSSTGEYLRALGRKGSGPGEYELPTGMVVAPDGRLLVRDTRSRSWTVFGPDGTYLENLRLDGSLGQVSSLRVGRDGSIVGLPNAVLLVQDGRLRQTYVVDGSASLSDSRHLPLIGLDADGQSPRIVAEVRMPEREAINGQLVETAFLPEPSWALMPDGRVVIVDSTSWEVRVVGSTETRITRPIAPMSVTARMRDDEVGRRAGLPNSGWGNAAMSSGSEAERGAALARAAEERLRAELHFADVRPVIRKVMTDPEGRIWVARTPRAVGPDATGPVDVLDPSGRYLGTVPDFSLPDAFGPGGLMAWIGKGDFDIPLVTIKRVTIPR